MNVYSQAQQFRRLLMAQDGQAASALIEAYGVAWEGIEARLMTLLSNAESTRRANKTIPVSWLYEEQRLKQLQQQVEQEIARFTEFAGGTITQQQAEAVTAAQQHARQLVMTQLEPGQGRIALSWHQVPHHALQRLVGTLGNGSPLSSLLNQLPGSASATVRKTLIVGLTTGQHPRQIARQMQHALSGDLTRALTIARTETLRAYRSAAIEGYRANNDVVQGWQWVASLSERTCAACIALHGSYHSNDEEFASHVCCRCTPVPVTVSWDQLGVPGLPDTRPQIEDGSDWFDRQSESTQLAILGPSKWEAYQRGRITLSDLVGTHNSEEWGKSHYERSLQDAEAAAERKREKAA